jgi:hypothetical protein
MDYGNNDESPISMARAGFTASGIVFPSREKHAIMIREHMV